MAVSLTGEDLQPLTLRLDSLDSLETLETLGVLRDTRDTLIRKIVRIKEEEEEEGEGLIFSKISFLFKHRKDLKKSQFLPKNSKIRKF